MFVSIQVFAVYCVLGHGSIMKMPVKTSKACSAVELPTFLAILGDRVMQGEVEGFLLLSQSLHASGLHHQCAVKTHPSVVNSVEMLARITFTVPYHRLPYCMGRDRSVETRLNCDVIQRKWFTSAPRNWGQFSCHFFPILTPFWNQTMIDSSRSGSSF